MVILAQTNIPQTRMKKILQYLALGLLLASCSTDDDATINDPHLPGPSEYLPLRHGNYWVYDTQSPQFNGRDSLYTANDIIINGTAYTTFRTSALPTGFFSAALSGNSVSTADGKLTVTGGTSIAFTEDLPFDIAITDFVIFDANATPNTTLSTTTGTVEQPAADGITIKINYGLSSVAQSSVASYTTPDGTTYTNVKVMQMRLTIEVLAVIDAFNFQIPVMEDQQVLTSTQYYAENIGAVYVETDINYELQDLSLLNIELPIPPTGSEHQVEVLTEYNVAAF